MANDEQHSQILAMAVGTLSVRWRTVWFWGRFVEQTKDRPEVVFAGYPGVVRSAINPRM